MACKADARIGLGQTGQDASGPGIGRNGGRASWAGVGVPGAGSAGLRRPHAPRPAGQRV